MTNDGQNTVRSIIDTRPSLICEQRLFRNGAQPSPPPSPSPSGMDVTMTEGEPSAPCQRKVNIFAACGHAYISPPCTCCSPTRQQSFLPFPAKTPLSAFTPTLFKQTKFRQECPACQTLTLDFKLEISRQLYEDSRDMWGENDVDAIKDWENLAKASKAYHRLSMAIYRDSPQMTGWEQVYVGDVPNREHTVLA